LDLSRNRIEFLPAELGLCVRLRKLTVDHNRLRALPPELGECELLEEITASSNRIEFIPSTFARLQELRVLHLADNKIAEIPIEFADCSKLDEMDLTANDPSLDLVPPHKLADASMIRFALARERERKREEDRLRAANEELEALVRAYDFEKIALREEVSRLRAQNIQLLEDMPRTYLAVKRTLTTSCVIM
jgi:Leucine rich repeat